MSRQNSSPKAIAIGLVPNSGSAPPYGATRLAAEVVTMPRSPCAAIRRA
ncbi:MAG TPA: hypothetical protein VIL00_04850 [Pseudonocardiaceae bacterium]